MNSIFSEILNKCRSSDNEVRKQGEYEIELMADQDYGKLLLDCAKELAADGENRDNRLLCGTLIKNMIGFIPKHNDKWLNLNCELKSEIRTNTLSSLASLDKNVRRAAGLAVAGICKIDIPNAEWLDVIDVLINITGHDNEDFRISSITTLGYIAQEVIPSDIPILYIDRILSALINNLKKFNVLNFEEMKSTITSFLNFIVFASKNMIVTVKFIYIIICLILNLFNDISFVGGL